MDNQNNLPQAPAENKLSIISESQFGSLLAVMALRAKAGEDLSAVVNLHIASIKEVLNEFATMVDYYGNKKYPDLADKINKVSVERCLRTAVVKNHSLDKMYGHYYFQIDKAGGGYDLAISPKVSTTIEEAYDSGIVRSHKQPEAIFNADGTLKEVRVVFTTRAGNEIRTFTAKDFERWQMFSGKRFKPKGTRDEQILAANALYRAGVNGTIDAEFAKTKALQHTFKKFKPNPMNYLNPNWGRIQYIESDVYSDAYAQEFEVIATAEADGDLTIITPEI